MQRGILQEEIYNPILNENTKGFLDNQKMEELRKNVTYGYILQGMELRPDLVAEYYLGDPTMSWAITYINNFFNGIEDYTAGKKIKIPII